jgi:hypothetical protein
MITEKEKNNLFLSLKRTIVPILIGIIMASFLGQYVEDVQGLSNTLSSILAAVYYSVIRLVETKFPKAGILLGAKAQPNYKPLK